MKKYLIVILLIPLIISLAGCQENAADLRISPEITEYSPVMSSTPGIALSAVFTRDLKNSDLKYHWKAEQGTFLMWHDEGKGRLQDLGSDIMTNVHKVYWTVSPKEAIPVKTFKIYLTVENIYTSEVLAETSMQIEQRKEGYFTIEW